MNTAEQIASELQTRIQNLHPRQGDNLSMEMDSLKRVLLENPAACSLLMDEDIGMLATNLRRITGIALASATAAKEKKTAAPKAPKQKQLSAEEFNNALDDM